nr:hypothetical protein GCM10020093_104980 [Planobispora longispora]
MDVHGLVRAAVRDLPDVGEQLALADHLARPGRQVMEQVELPGLRSSGAPSRVASRLRGSIRRPPTVTELSARLSPDRRSTARTRASIWAALNGLTT